MRPRSSPRIRRSSRARRTIDLCPVCRCDMGGAAGGTRRIGLSSAERGLFLWECPDCSGRWEEAPGRPPRVLGPLPPRVAQEKVDRLAPRPAPD